MSFLKINYTPKVGFAIGDIKLDWKTKKDVVRSLLHDCTFTETLHLDCYSKIGGIDCYIVFGYTDEELESIEISRGVAVVIDNVPVVVSSGDNFHNVLEKISGFVEAGDCIETDVDSHTFESLEMILSADSIGSGKSSDENSLAYIYLGQLYGLLDK